MEDIYAPKIEIPEEKWNPEEKQSFLGSLRVHLVDFIQSLVVFGAIFAIIYLFIAQPHKVSGQSMFPTFKNGDYILTDKVSYRIKDPVRGEVVVLKNPKNPSQDFIKRIIALPGDSIKVENTFVFVNGVQISEHYLPAGTPTRGGNFLKEGELRSLAPDEFIVIGDNREHSSDGREWGPTGKKGIIGKVFIRYWPPNAIGFTGKT